MVFVRALIKISLVFGLIFIFVGISAFIGLVIPGFFRRQKYRTCVQSWFCRLGLRVLNVEVQTLGFQKKNHQTHLMVGNHMSYLDILILSRLYPSSYVTSQEIRETPFLGRLCEWAGCLFVERRNRENLSKEVSQISEALRNDLTVTIFPEATSTNGDEILRFRSPLYQAAIDAKVPVQAFCLNYLRVNGASFSQGNRDFVCWYGDMDFLPHLWALCRLRSVKASVHFLESIPIASSADPKQLAQTTHHQVCSRYAAPSP